MTVIGHDVYLSKSTKIHVYTQSRCGRFSVLHPIYPLLSRDVAGRGAGRPRSATRRARETTTKLCTPAAPGIEASRVSQRTERRYPAFADSGSRLERTPNAAAAAAAAAALSAPCSPTCTAALFSTREPNCVCCPSCSVSTPVALCDGSWRGSCARLSHQRARYFPDSVLCAVCQSCLLSCWCIRQWNMLCAPMHLHHCSSITCLACKAVYLLISIASGVSAALTFTYPCAAQVQRHADE